MVFTVVCLCQCLFLAQMAFSYGDSCSKKQCSGSSNFQISCYVGSTGCDVKFPTPVFRLSDNDLTGNYSIHMNYTPAILDGYHNSTSFTSVVNGAAFSFEELYTFDRYGVGIVYVRRDDDDNPVSAEFKFVIKNTVLEDSGAYHIILTNGSEDFVIYKHTYRLFNSGSPKPVPVCSTLPYPGTAHIKLKCSVLGHFYPDIALEIGATNILYPERVISLNSTTEERPGWTAVYSYGNDIFRENISFTCVVRQGTGSVPEVVSSCTFHPVTVDTTATSTTLLLYTDDVVTSLSYDISDDVGTISLLGLILVVIFILFGLLILLLCITVRRKRKRRQEGTDLPQEKSTHQRAAHFKEGEPFTCPTERYDQTTGGVDPYSKEPISVSQVSRSEDYFGWIGEGNCYSAQVKEEVYDPVNLSDEDATEGDVLYDRELF